MSPEIALYLINLLSNVNLILVISLPIMILIIIIFLCSFSGEHDDICVKENCDHKSIFNKLMNITIILFLLWLLIPSEKTMYTIAATHYIKQSDLPAKVLTVINSKLDEVIANDKPSHGNTK